MKASVTSYLISYINKNNKLTKQINIMNKTQNNSGLGYALFFILTFLMFAGYASATFLINTIIPAIGIWHLLLIPVAWELIKLGVKSLLAIIEVVANSDKLIEKDNN